MQVKIIIGTIAFMLTMILLGFYALLEPARLERFTGARLGRQVEAGAELYFNNCANCHGINADAKECYDAATGEQIACQGLPLNHPGLLCGEPSSRMTAWGWKGTKEAFIYATVSAGRPGGIMATWSQDYGGPLQRNEVENLTKFVLNFETDGLCAIPVFQFPWPEDIADLPAVTPDAIVLVPGQTFDTSVLPVQFPGNAEAGAAAFKARGCNACHGLPEDGPASALIGPWQGNLGNEAATRVPGLSAENYVYRSILHPSEYIVPQCPSGPCAGPPSTMPGNYITDLGPQELADLVTYLLEQKQP